MWEVEKRSFFKIVYGLERTYVNKHTMNLGKFLLNKFKINRVIKL